MNFSIQVTRMNEYCYINAIYNGEKIGGVCVALNSNDTARFMKRYSGKFAKIVLVSTSGNYTRQGVATALLNKTIEVLKDYNLFLNVIPNKRNGNDKDKNQLIAFYSKFGFERYKDDVLVTTMVRITK